ncbi:MAG: cytochrome c [Acidimicrobiia bacterium]|nr:cytochrome c [Acidimicrobiia bacterium]
MRTSIPLALLFTAGLLAGAAAAQEKGNADAAKMQNPVAPSTESIAAGKEAYDRNCRFCHSADGTGGPPKDAGFPEASNLVDETWDYGSTDGEIYTVIRKGTPPEFAMEPWDDRLDETETWNLVNYLRALAKGAK